jgi:signal transduction histidine kinase
MKNAPRAESRIERRPHRCGNVGRSGRRDSGVGIAAADLPCLMKPFEQVARGYSQRDGGTGLGLSLVDALVRLHQGTFDIQSTVGEGTTVTVRLPSRESALLAA